MIRALVMGRRLPGMGENVTVVESGVGRAFRKDQLGGDSTTLSFCTIHGARLMCGTIPGVLLCVIC